MSWRYHNLFNTQMKFILNFLFLLKYESNLIYFKDDSNLICLWTNVLMSK